MNYYKHNPGVVLGLLENIQEVYDKHDDVLFQFSDDVLAFRGTETVRDWMVDAYALQVPHKIVIEEPVRFSIDAGKIHAGFSTRWTNIRNNVLKSVTDIYPETDKTRTLLITGHSLGGAMAVLASLELVLRGWNVCVVTFGSPKVGDSDFARLIKYNFKEKYLRVENHGDWITQVPGIQDWSHAGEKFRVGSWTNYLRLPMSRHHLMDSYRKSLKSLQTT